MQAQLASPVLRWKLNTLGQSAVTVLGRHIWGAACKFCGFIGKTFLPTDFSAFLCLSQRTLHGNKLIFSNSFILATGCYPLPESSWSHNYPCNCPQCAAEDYAAGAHELLNKSCFLIDSIRKEGQRVKQGNITESDIAALELRYLLLVLG